MYTATINYNITLMYIIVIVRLNSSKVMSFFKLFFPSLRVHVI